MTTIAEKLTTIKNALNDIKNSIIAKGQTPTGDITTYATSINNIESGTAINNQDKTITSNGTYTADEGYTGLGTVTVNVEGGSSEFIGIPREVSSAGVYGFPVENFTFKLPSDAKDLSEHSLYYAFQNCTSLTSVDLSSLTTISGNGALYYAFQNCTSLTSIDLSSLTTISGSNALYDAFHNCEFLTSVDLSSLTTISGSNALYGAFEYCTSLTSLDLSSLTTISKSKGLVSAFRYCTSLTSVDLSSLTNIGVYTSLASAFSGCTSLTELSFPALTSLSFGTYTNQFNSMLSFVSGCTVHFPSNLESVIGSWSDVTAGFGGTNTTVLFDLPATK